jgi:cytochrome P450/NADPH-cytochrome P450 reductase
MFPMAAGADEIAGVLSFVIHNLLTTPSAMSKMRAEVDSVVGERVVTLEDIPKMPYMTAVIREVRFRSSRPFCGS